MHHTKPLVWQFFKCSPSSMYYLFLVFISMHYHNYLHFDECREKATSRWNCQTSLGTSQQKGRTKKPKQSFYLALLLSSRTQIVPKSPPRQRCQDDKYYHAKNNLCSALTVSPGSCNCIRTAGVAGHDLHVKRERERKDEDVQRSGYCIIFWSSS